jgi:hypothetical protein
MTCSHMKSKDNNRTCQVKYLISTNRIGRSTTMLPDKFCDCYHKSIALESYKAPPLIYKLRAQDKRRVTAEPMKKRFSRTR